jgi:hypothetical protein
LQPFVMVMQENLVKFELNQSLDGSLPGLLDPMTELSWILYAQRRPKTRLAK